MKVSHTLPFAHSREALLSDAALRWTTAWSMRRVIECCAGAILLAGLVSGCGSGKSDSDSAPKSITLGNDPKPIDVQPSDETNKPAVSENVASTGTGASTAEPVNEKPNDTDKLDKPNATPDTEPGPGKSPNEAAVAESAQTRTFKVEGPEQALRVSYDDVDLLKVMNLDPVPPDAPQRLPMWLKELDGKRIRVRGFMFPPFQDKDIRGFVLARDNQICCFGRTPKEYDLIDIFMRKGQTTHYIQNRPFDVVGVFRIKSEIEKYTAMYEMEDAVVIEK